MTNRATSRLLGYTEVEMIGQPATEVFVEESQRVFTDSGIRSMFSGGPTSDVHTTLVTTRRERLSRYLYPGACCETKTATSRAWFLSVGI